MASNSFSIKERLKKNKAIKAVLDEGVYFRAGLINVYILKRPDTGYNRAAFICKKTLHQKKSVLRNRVRRLLKEAYRKTKQIIPVGHDIVIVGTRITKNILSTDIEKEIANVFKKYIKK
ncbi:MAG: ribonuclease P protein component [Candidatus Omnitrophota bacterium]|jgi:ribonuclease P protein component